MIPAQSILTRNAHRRCQAFVHGVYRLVGTTLLALCVHWTGAHAQSATPAKRIPLASKAWLPLFQWGPFQWKNGDEQTLLQQSRTPPQPVPKQGYGLSGLNVFRWTNEDSTDSNAPVPPPVRSVKRSPPPNSMSPVIATDGPEQPKSVLSASVKAAANKTRTEKQVAYERAPIDWPPAPASVPPQYQSSDQSVNPFGWSNSAPTTDQELLPQRLTIASERLSEMKTAMKKPWLWSDDPRGKEKPQPLTPPEQPSFSAAVHDALSWAEQPDESDAEALARSFPPADATVAEVIEWEKQTYPWIRPFYWADEDRYEIAFENEFGPEDPTASPKYVPLLARPFTWSDSKRSPSQQAKPLIAPDVSRRTRTVAFLQDGETLPRPLPALNPSEVVSPENGEQSQQDADEDSQNEFDAEGKGKLAQAETLGREPEDNILQFLRADTVLLKPGQFQYDYGMTYSKFDLTLPVLVSTGPSTVTVEHAEFRIREMKIPLEVRYGLARRIQLFLNVPFGWANTELTFPGFEEFENGGGLGDIIFGGSFLLREGDREKPDTILSLASVAPTGKDPFTPTGLSPTSPTLGGGTWSIASNLLFIRSYDPVVVFYGVGTRQHFLSKFEGVSFRPGGEYNYQFGIGFAVNNRVTFSTRFNGAYVSEIRLAGQRVQGTIQEPMTLGLAMTVSKDKKLVEPFIDFGLTDDASDARFGITWTR